MKNRIIIIAALIVFGSNAQDSTNVLRNNELIVGSGINTSYGYLTPNLIYNTPGFFRGNKVSLSFNYEGFRPAKFILSEVNRLNSSARFKFEKGKFTTLPEIGFTWFFDITDASNNTAGMSLAPSIGNLSFFKLNKLHLYLDQGVTFFTDGLWLELFPLVGYRFAPYFEPQLGMNMIFATTYSGVSDFAPYPYLKLAWYLKSKR